MGRLDAGLRHGLCCVYAAAETVTTRKEGAMSVRSVVLVASSGDKVAKKERLSKHLFASMVKVKPKTIM